MGKISIPIDEAWTEFKKLGYHDEIIMATNEECGIEVVMNYFYKSAYLTVVCDSDIIDENCCNNKQELEESLRLMYDTYINASSVDVTGEILDKLSKVVDNDLADENKKYSSEIIERRIDDNEQEMTNLVEDLVTGLAPNAMKICGKDYDEMIESLKDGISEFLYTEYGISIYRPMYLEDDKGILEFYEYPYSHMDLG